MDYESVKYVEGFVENIIFRNEDNGYTVFNIVYDDEEITCVGVLSYINTGEFITCSLKSHLMSSGRRMMLHP